MSEISKFSRRDLLRGTLAVTAFASIGNAAKLPISALDSTKVDDVLPIVFDTDMGNDVDDALALAMLHALESRRECRLIAVTITKDNRWSAPYVNLVNTFYGRADIPIGVVRRSGVAPENSQMIQLPSERRKANGGFVYPHRLLSGETAPEAVAVLRRVLSAEGDKSVKIVQVGFSTNLARLLDSPPDIYSPLKGKELVERKVKQLCVMAGNFADGKSEYNVQMDVPSAQKVFGEWPTEIAASGFEIGESMPFPASSIEKDFAYVDDHPIAEGYRDYKPMPYDRPTWDLTAALFAVRPDRNYFSLSSFGEISASADGRTRFDVKASGRHRYLKMDQLQRARTLECMIQLASQPPRFVLK